MPSQREGHIRAKSDKFVKSQAKAWSTTHVTFLEKDWEEMKSNEPERQKVDTQNSEQLAKLVKLMLTYSTIHRAKL